jgi:hypothetical protein
MSQTSRSKTSSVTSGLDFWVEIRPVCLTGKNDDMPDKNLLVFWEDVNAEAGAIQDRHLE